MIPTMSTGGRDSRFRGTGMRPLRVSGLFLGPDDARSHSLS